MGNGVSHSESGGKLSGTLDSVHRKSVHPSIHASMHPSMHLSLPPSIHPCVHLSTHLFGQPASQPAGLAVMMSRVTTCFSPPVQRGRRAHKWSFQPGVTVCGREGTKWYRRTGENSQLSLEGQQRLPGEAAVGAGLGECVAWAGQEQGRGPGLRVYRRHGK